MARVGIFSSVVGYLVFGKAPRVLPALKHGTELGVCHTQHVHGEEITMYPAVQDVWANFVCRRSAVDFQIFKAHISRKAKERYGHLLWMNVSGSSHEAGVITHAAVQFHQGMDARVSC